MKICKRKRIQEKKLEKSKWGNNIQHAFCLTCPKFSLILKSLNKRLSSYFVLFLSYKNTDSLSESSDSIGSMK